MDSKSLKDIRGNYFGSIFLDNLTLTCALQVIDQRDTISLKDQYVNFQRSLEDYPSLEEEKISRRDKWDYDLNNAFRFAVDIHSLAQMIEAIVLFDKVFVDSSYVNSWSVKEGQFENQQEHFPLPITALNNQVMPVRLHPIERLTLLHNAVDGIKEDVRSGILPYFLALLSQTSTESVFLHMSHGYFRTGYSDQALFPDMLKFTSAAFADLPRFSTGIDVISNLKLPGLIDSLRRKFDSLINSQDNDFALRETEFYRGDSHDKLTASEDILRSAVAAYFYEDIAASCGLGYLPHLMRSYFLVFNQITKQRGVGSTASSIVNCLQEFRKAEVRTIDSFYQGTIIDVSLPFVLSLVLEKASKPSDILPIALELRESKQARDFRSWVAEIDYRIATGKIDLTALSKEIEKIQRVIRSWINIQDTTEQEVTSWSISISRGTFKLPLPFRVPSRWQLPQSNHLLFLQRLAQVSNRTPRFDTHLQKTFGPELAAHWRQYRHVIDTFIAPSTVPQGIRLSPLSKENFKSERAREKDRPMINILFLAANPKDMIHLRLDEEIREIDQVLRQAEFRERFTLHQHWAVRVTDLQECLLRHKPHIVHFSGHGTRFSEIVLEDRNGNSHVVTTSSLGQLFSVLKSHIRCVVLNCCYSELQAQAIAQHIDCVIGMSNAIGDPASVSFATAFYRALGYGMSIKTAFDLGCSSTQLGRARGTKYTETLSYEMRSH